MSAASTSFPFPLPDARGEPLETANGLLLRGARVHRRPYLFREDGEEWPDWRADRQSIRLGLALDERLGLRAGDVACLWLPHGVRATLLERAVWALGAASLFLPFETPAAVVGRTLERVRARLLVATDGAALARLREAAPRASLPLVALDAPPADVPSYGVLLDAGGILDTPERAVRLRERARRVAPGTTASLELEADVLRPWTQSDIAAAMRAAARRWPPGRPAGRCVASRGGRLALRIAVAAAWADGLSRVDFVDPEREDAPAAMASADLVLADASEGALVEPALRRRRRPLFAALRRPRRPDLFLLGAASALDEGEDRWTEAS